MSSTYRAKSSMQTLCLEQIMARNHDAGMTDDLDKPHVFLSSPSTWTLSRRFDANSSVKVQRVCSFRWKADSDQAQPLWPSDLSATFKAIYNICRASIRHSLTLPATARYNGREVDVSSMTGTHMEAVGAQKKPPQPLSGVIISFSTTLRLAA